MDLPITGGCICKAVRFSAKAPPVRVRQCWCRDCQYFGAGSSTVNAIFNVADITFSGADLTVFESDADSGNRMVRGFCPTCGTPVTSASRARPDYLIIRVGAFDDPSIAAPDLDIWTASAPHWVILDADRPSSPGQPA